MEIMAPFQNVGCHIRTRLQQGAKGISGNLAVPGDDIGAVLNKFQATCDAFLQTWDSFLPVHTTRLTNIWSYEMYSMKDECKLS